MPHLRCSSLKGSMHMRQGAQCQAHDPGWREGSLRQKPDVVNCRNVMCQLWFNEAEAGDQEVEEEEGEGRRVKGGGG